MACEGQLLKIQDFQALYSVIGTRYGGDGIKTFGLPDMRGMVALGASPTQPTGTTGDKLACSQKIPATADGTTTTMNVDVRQPYVALRYLICVERGDYPPRDEDRSGPEY